MADEAQLRQRMVETGAHLWRRGLVGAAEGNLSVRLSPDTILCTPSGVSKGSLRPEELVVTDLAGKPIGAGQPSSELRLHLRFYRERPDCGAVVHAHPPCATAFALAHRPIPDGLLPEAVVVLGSIKLCPFGMPGTEELPESLGESLQGHDCYLLANHGAVTVGRDLEEALFRMETLERVAVVYSQALCLGGPVRLPDEVVASLTQLRLASGIDA